MSEFILQTNSDIPLYRQLIDQIRRLAASGRLTAGERLPSVRQLAEELAINPMTISKAYSLLEAEGLLVRQRGIGMVLKTNTRAPEDLLKPAVRELVRQARQLELSRESLLQQVHQAWEEDHNE